MAKGLTRRLFLRSAPAATLAAEAVARKAVENAGMQVAGNVSGGVNGPATGAVGLNEGQKLFSFAQWLSQGGEKSIRQQSRQVSVVDADIAVMQLPLVTKVRMQRVRNYDRMMAEQEGWFKQVLKQQGHVMWWG